VKTLSLRTLRLRPGEEYRDEIELELEPFELGGQRYVPVPERVPAELVASRASTGTVFELRFRVRLHEPCYRCLEDAVLDRLVFGRRLSPAAILGLLIGFAGVALLVRPGGGVDALAALTLIGTTGAWAAGSLYARGAPLPQSPLLSAAMQMLAASVMLGISGLAFGEGGQIHADAFSAKPLAAWTYLVLVGSLVAFSAYGWLLKNVRISVVSTYAFVNPVVAVALGALFLGEDMTVSTLVAGASIVAAVVLIVTGRERAPRVAPVTVRATT